MHQCKGHETILINSSRRQVSLYHFRQFIKTIISGYADFSEWFLGHSGSTYWTKKDSEKAEIFSKVEPYLTFLNIPRLEKCRHANKSRRTRDGKSNTKKTS